MEKKAYSTFEEIDNELEILKVQKEINYQRVVLGVQNVKDKFTPSGVSKIAIDSFKNFFASSYGTLFKYAMPFVIKWILTKKRGK